jgi:hypothetical protein
MYMLKPLVLGAMLGVGLGFVGGAVIAAGVHMYAPTAAPVPDGGPVVVAGLWAVCGTAIGLVAGTCIGVVIGVVSGVVGAARRRRDARPRR